MTRRTRPVCPPGREAPALAVINCLLVRLAALLSGFLCLALSGLGTVAHAQSLSPLSRTPAAKTAPPPTQGELDRSLILAAMAGNALDTLIAIKSGANVEVRDSHGLTALDYAALFGHADVFQVLLEQKADVFAPSQGRYSLKGTSVPVHVAATQARRLADDRWASHAIHYGGHDVGEPWPYRGKIEREPYQNQFWPATAVSTRGVKTYRPGPAASAPGSAPTGGSPAPTPSTAVPAVGTSTAACRALEQTETDSLNLWCDRTARKVKSACLVAECGGEHKIENGAVVCLACKGSSPTKILTASGGGKWELGEGGQPLAPGAELKHFPLVCGAATPSFCDKSAGSYRAILLFQTQSCRELGACEGLPWPPGP